MRASVARCGPIAEGDWLALTRDGGIIATDDSPADAVCHLLADLVDVPEPVYGCIGAAELEDQPIAITVAAGADRL